MPSHRVLAEAINVARQTLALAIGTLLEEQLLKTAHGQGTWTSRPVTPYSPLPANAELSSRAQRVLGGPGASMIQSGAFVPGIPDIAQFPMRKWRQLYSSNNANAPLWRSTRPLSKRTIKVRFFSYAFV